VVASWTADALPAADTPITSVFVEVNVNGSAGGTGLLGEGLPCAMVLGPAWWRVRANPRAPPARASTATPTSTRTRARRRPAWRTVRPASACPSGCPERVTPSGSPAGRSAGGAERIGARG